MPQQPAPAPTHRPPALSAVALFWIATIGILVGAGMLRSFAPERFSALSWGVTSSIGLLALTGAFLRWEGRDAASIGLHWRRASLGRFCVGAAIGAALYGMSLLLVVILTDIRIEMAPGVASATILLALLTYVMLAIMEEVGFRGYALRRLEERLGRPWALGLGAVVFGIVHLAYGWTLGAALVGAGAGALLFGIAALACRGLAIPIGMHAAWNLAGWSVGEKDGAGVWQLVIPQTASEPATIGAVSYLAVMLLGFVGFWLFGRSSSSRSSSPLT